MVFWIIVIWNYKSDKLCFSAINFLFISVNQIFKFDSETTVHTQNLQKNTQKNRTPLLNCVFTILVFFVFIFEKRFFVLMRSFVFCFYVFICSVILGLFVYNLHDVIIKHTNTEKWEQTNEFYNLLT